MPHSNEEQSENFRSTELVLFNMCFAEPDAPPLHAIDDNQLPDPAAGHAHTASATPASIPSSSSKGSSVVLLDIHDVGVWYIKFRPSGVIVNNRDLVGGRDVIDVDACITFFTSGPFWAVVNGGIQLQDFINRKLVRCSGSHAELERLWSHLVSSAPEGRSRVLQGAYQPQAAATSSSGAGAGAGAGSGANGEGSGSGERAGPGVDGDGSGGGGGGVKRSPARKLHPKGTEPSATSGGSGAETRPTSYPPTATVPSQQPQQPLKAGWLLKKRDRLSGWRARYFIVYPGRFEYYLDKHDVSAKGVVSLSGAEVYAAKRCTINGAEHFYFSVEPRGSDPQEATGRLTSGLSGGSSSGGGGEKLRLASEMHGDNGMVDAATWVQVFLIASKPVFVPSVAPPTAKQLLSQPPAVPPPPPQPEGGSPHAGSPGSRGSGADSPQHSSVRRKGSTAAAEDVPNPRSRRSTTAASQPDSLRVSVEDGSQWPQHGSDEYVTPTSGTSAGSTTSGGGAGGTFSTRPARSRGYSITDAMGTAVSLGRSVGNALKGGGGGAGDGSPPQRHGSKGGRGGASGGGDGGGEAHSTPAKTPSSQQQLQQQHQQQLGDSASASTLQYRNVERVLFSLSAVLQDDPFADALNAQTGSSSDPPAATAAVDTLHGGGSEQPNPSQFQSSAYFSTCTTVVLDVQDVGVWYVKLRPSGVIVNNRDLVGDANVLDVDATITFLSGSGPFWAVVNGGIDIKDALAKGLVACTGQMKSVELLWDQLCSLNATASGGSDGSGAGGSAMASIASVLASSSRIAKKIRNIAGGSAAVGAEVDAVAPPGATGAPHSAHLEGTSPAAGLGSATVALKAGWLLKKRDLLSGWRARYFVVYPGRLEYFLDKHDVSAKGVVSLSGAEVYAAKRCTISGSSDHWFFTVEPSSSSAVRAGAGSGSGGSSSAGGANGGERLRLASEMVGDEGMVDAATWVQVLLIASGRNPRNDRREVNGTGGGGEPIRAGDEAGGERGGAAGGAVGSPATVAGAAGGGLDAIIDPSALNNGLSASKSWSDLSSTSVVLTASVVVLLIALGAALYLRYPPLAPFAWPTPASAASE